MNFLKMIEQLNNMSLANVISIGMLPNDGGIIEGFPEAVLSFDEKTFTIYTFKGFFRPQYEGESFAFSFLDIKEIEMGKYNFRDTYIKITFKDEKFIAFSYFLKVKGYKPQKPNMQAFIEILESISTEEQE